jgi:hypothetical protein
MIAKIEESKFVLGRAVNHPILIALIVSVKPIK